MESQQSGHVPPPDSRHWRRTLYAMWLAMFFVFLEGQFSLTFLPVFLQDDLHLSLRQAEAWSGPLIAFPSLAMFFAQPLWGMYADRHGRKSVVIVGIVCTSLLRALWAFAHGPLTLVVLGVFAGLLGAGVIAGQAIVASVAPRERMGEVMGKLQTAMTVGFLIGPVVGQACASAIGPRNTFLVQAVFALTGAIVLWLFVEERFERPTQVEKVGLAAVLTRDLRPLVGNRQLQALWVTAFVVFLGWSTMWPIMVYYVQTIGVPLKQVPAYAAYVMLATGTAQTLSAPWFGKLGDRIGQKRVLVGATVAAGAFILPHALVQTYAQFFGLRVLATTCGAGVNPSTGALVARSMPRERYGGAYGVLATARALAASVGPLIGSQLAAFGNIRWVFLWTGALTLAAGLWAQWAVRETDGAEAQRRKGSAEEGGNSSGRES